MNTSRKWLVKIPSDEPLSLEQLEEAARFLGKTTTWLHPDDRRALTDSLETTVLVRSQRAWREITEASIALFLIREHGLWLGKLNELDLPMETWNQYLGYMGRRGMARSTSFKHLASLMVFHKGLGRSLFGALRIPGGVQSLDHIKALVEYNVKTGEILGPKKEVLLERLPYPDDDLTSRLNSILDEIETGGPKELELSPRSVAKLLRQDYGGEEQINFFWTLGPWGEALGWYFCNTELNSSRGIVGIDPMPPVVAHKLRLWARVTERDPTPFAEQLLKEDKMYHSITIAGHVGRDVETRFTPAGKQVANFPVATNRKWTNQDGTPGEQTTWFRITAWGRLAEIVAEYLSKGNPVLVIGHMNTNEFGSPKIWTTQDGEPRASFEVTADQVRFLGRGTAREESEEERSSPVTEDEMELPF